MTNVQPKPVMEWKTEPPAEAGFYFYSGAAMYCKYGPDAVQVCQLSKYKNQEGFNLQFLNVLRPVQEALIWDASLEKFLQTYENGMWAGPLPQPYFRTNHR